MGPKRRIIVDGFGLLSPLGRSAWQTFMSLLAGTTLQRRTADLPEPIDAMELVCRAGSVGLTRSAAVDPSVDLAEAAAREAACAAGTEIRGMPTFLGTSKGAVHALSAAAQRALAAGRRPRNADEQTPYGTWDASTIGLGPNRLCPVPPEAAVALGPHGYLAHQLRRRLDLGPVHHAVAACAASLTAMDQARRFLLYGADQPPCNKRGSHCALVVTAEAALLPIFVHSYRKLGVLAPLDRQGYRHLPLDRRRQGFMLSELAAAVLLRRIPDGAEPRPGQIELLDTAVACEAYDMVRPSPTMGALRHIADRLLGARTRQPVAMIHPHAPGTVDHDPVELRVYAEALGARGRGTAPVDVYASKGALGHGLGAAGLVSLVVACLCLQSGRRPPMPWVEQPIAVDHGRLIIDADPRPCRRSAAHAVFASGFCGHVAGAVLQRH